MELAEYTQAQLEKYRHHSGSGDLDAFLRKFKPSVIEMRDSPWIWVTRILAEASENEAVAVSRGADILSDLVARMKEIETDDSIPTRGKKGVESKKVVRERAQADATEALKTLSLEKKYTHGKWLLYPSHEHVDAVWARVAKSVDHGPLSKAGATGAKVATTENPEQSHVICVYYDNVYDKEQTEKILTALLNHGLEPSAVKSDLYTAIGLDSKHPAKMRSSVWRPVDFMSKDEIKTLKEGWTKEKEAALYEAGGELCFELQELTKGEEEVSEKSKLRTQTKLTSAAQPSEKPVSAAPKPSVKRALPPTDEAPPKRIKSKARVFRDNDIFAGSSDDEDE